MTHPSPRFSSFVLCAGLLFACGNTTRNHTDDNATSGPAGPTNGGPTNGGTTNGGTTNGGTTNGGTTDGGTGGGGSDCPSLEPAAGSSCDLENRVCPYANCTAPDYRDYHELNCINGAWVLAITEACQVGPCPADPPRIGGYCNVSSTPGPCSAVDACGDVREVVCTDYGWETTDNKIPDRPGSGAGGAGEAPAAPVCPAYPPFAYEVCCPATVPERCDYTEAGTDGAAGASFIALPVTSTGGDFDPPDELQCAVCTDQMFWDRCPVEE